MLTDLDISTIDLIEQEYKKCNLPWALGYSGGKDSSALLKLVYNALLNIKNPQKQINAIYCDTGVEIPIITNYVKETFNLLKEETTELGIPINFRIVEPKLEYRFFVKVIGRGYPTPTNKFRWCTDKLRVLPLQGQYNSNSKNVVLIGVRKGESQERDKIIQSNNTEKPYFLRQADYPNVSLFAPILDYKVSDIWSIVKSNQKPTSIKGFDLEMIYQKAGEEQIDFIDKSSNALQKGRFGCWTCTVVRKDKAVKNLIANGYANLSPLLEFRDWIYVLRDNLEYRCKYRRNGVKSLGPFTLEARKVILDRLLKAQSESGYELITEKEIDYIYYLWEKDKKDIKYNNNNAL